MSWPPGANSIELSGAWEIQRDGDEAWRAAPVPSAWQRTLGFDFHGVAWYRRRFELTDDLLAALRGGRRFWLRFESVATDVTAWIGDVEVGRHVGDYAPFQLDVTEVLAATGDEEWLVLRVDEMHAPPPTVDGDLQNGHLTKGFHDVISLQHGGVWQPVHLAHTGAVVAVPDGVAVRADPATGVVGVQVEIEPGASAAAWVEIEVRDPAGNAAAGTRASATDAGAAVAATVRVDDPARWSPERPALYDAIVRLGDDRGVSETHEIRFGFRSLRADGRTIQLNGRPLMIRGVLDWGHEPEHVAPAPTAAEVRERFAYLRAMGFNCVCLCMWYPPRYFFDIADETGMLVWQEHPVWQSRMDEDDLVEYRRRYEAFLRRDRNHASLAVVSATCEHPCFHPDLASWWWTRARRDLPGVLLQVQTAFFRWADPDRTDLHDEHTYDNSNRWVTYVDDVQEHLRDLPARPFVMGETILFTSWPDVGGIRAGARDGPAWWRPRSLDSMAALERTWRERYGDDAIDRFRLQGDRFHLLGRKFQVEQFRRHAGNAGIVMNHLRDVPQCQCGLMDDFGRWRFAPEETRGWLGDASILLWTPDHRRGFSASETRPLACAIALSNFGARDFAGAVNVSLEGEVAARVHLACPAGDVRVAPCPLTLPVVDAPTRVCVRAVANGLAPNAWELWLFPGVDLGAGGRAVRFSGTSYAPADAEPDEVERAYSRGYGLPVRAWRCVLPDPAVLAPEVPAWDGADAPPPAARLVLTHRLTPRIVDWLAAGGRVLLFASKAAGGLGTSYEWLFGQVPLVVEDGPLAPGDSAWMVDLLGYDLTRRYARVIPVETLGLAERVDPLVRLAYTHDQSHVKLFDMLFQTRVGRGHLMVSSLDHTEAPGRYLLRRMVDYLAGGTVTATAEIDVDLLRGLTA